MKVSAPNAAITYFTLYTAGHSLGIRVNFCMNHTLYFKIVQNLGQRHSFSVAIISRFCSGEEKMLSF